MSRLTIAQENQLPGTPASTWDISGAGDPSIQGFATDISVNQGQTVSFKINDASGAPYHIDIYRMGYYQGNGAHLVTSIPSSQTLHLAQHDAPIDPTTGLLDDGSWAVSASWSVPSDATSGIYFAKVIRDDTRGASHIVFVVRDDTDHSQILFQTSDSTWEAYNDYGGNSLYTGNSGVASGRAVKVSYNRPFNTRADSSEDFVFNSEYPMVRWLEANGYDVSYFTDVDSDRNGALIKNHQIFMSVGHDEYWSGPQRTNVEAARDAGVNLAFFSGNEIFWKTRWESSSAGGTNTPYRTLVCYKETHANAVIDPMDPPTWTGAWRDPRFSPPADGGRPENALSGTIFMVNGVRNDAIKVPAADGKLRFWRNTSIATLAPGATATLPAGTLGYEWDEDLDNGFRPAGLMDLSSTTLDVSPDLLLDYGSTYGSGTATHSLTLYRASSGALVFGAGTTQWSWGLDSHHDRGSAAPDVRMQQATVNLLADMGVQPSTLQAGLVAVTASTDRTPPTSIITAPAPGTTVPSGTPVTITVTATDTGGGVVGGVEVSVDGGTTWHPATWNPSTSRWSYTWTPGGSSGPVTIKSRAVDDSGNLEIPGAGITVTVQGQNNSSGTRIFSATATPNRPDEGPDSPVEVGVKFRSDVAGSITGIRFYKSSTNTGTHIGDLWDSAGHRLASATFTNETASGWQQVTFATPVPIQANTVYVASYHTNVGHYAEDDGYFTSAVDSGTMHALADGTSGPNGVYAYGSTSMFPNTGYQASNYWVDVAFTPGGTSTTPAVTTTSPASNATNVAVTTTVTATFNEAMNPATITTGTFTLTGPNNTSVAGSVTYNNTTNTATFTPNAPLANSTTYTATIVGGTTGVQDVSGNAMGTNDTWSFTTAAPIGSGPYSLWSSTDVPGTPFVADSAVEVGVKFTANVAGTITGIRFYKGVGNTGTHIGNLWSSTGTLLASATFTGETASGWQQVNFATPVPITAGTIYVASYHSNTGYAEDDNDFTTARSNGPLTALADGTSGPDGVYRYGTGSVFPNTGYLKTNYWVDVVFSLSSGTESAAPAASLLTAVPAAPAADAVATPVGTGVGAVAPASTTLTAAATSPDGGAIVSEAMDPTTINERKRLRAPQRLSAQGTG